MAELKALADDKSKVAKIMISLFGRVENTVGKGDNAVYQHFLLFQQCFSKPSYFRVIKKSNCAVESSWLVDCIGV